MMSQYPFENNRDAKTSPEVAVRKSDGVLFAGTFAGVLALIDQKYGSQRGVHTNNRRDSQWFTTAI